MTAFARARALAAGVDNTGGQFDVYKGCLQGASCAASSA